MSSRLRIKICGITCVEDALAAARLGADAIGLNFHLASPRFVSLSTAAEIVAGLPPFVEPVAVVTDAKTLCDLYLCELYRTLRFKYLQWHGPFEELPESAFGLAARMVIAFRIRDEQSLANADRWLQGRNAAAMPAAILIDGYHKDALGGTGQTAPWELLAGWQPGVPLILAGGLTPNNVAEAVRIVKPYAVDVASGVESSPGRKDVDKLRRFIENARAAE